MPCLSDVRAANAAILGALKNVPVAVFVGGTSGIGQATAEAFARHTKGNAHIIICGRNRQGKPSSRPLMATLVCSRMMTPRSGGEDIRDLP
jgi:NAD(P)-dependent dehydrogenase (short-subunit alcohol dehydrogenase family)